MQAKDQSPALARVARGDLCAGCGACAALAPGKVVMAVEEPGYLRPVQSAPLDPAEEAAIARVCPGLGIRVDPAAGRSDPVLWGPYVSMRTGWATDDGLRFAASSGGALSAILVHLLEAGMVDAVVQTAASPDLAIGNATVISRVAAAIRDAAGSRYAPSAPLADLPLHVASGRRFAFVGKPCDAAALRQMAAGDPAVARTFPVILSFFCAGVPSHSGGEEVLKALGVGPAEVAAFRYRGLGWPGRATATLKDGSERSMSYHDSWGKILSRHVQHRCKICPDGIGSVADIVCADAWESDDRGYPRFSEAPGVSLIVARTPFGAEILSAAAAAGHVQLADFDPAALPAMQPGQSFRRRSVYARLLALRLAGRPVPDYQGIRLRAAALQNPLRKNLKNFLGMLRRLPRNRRAESRTGASS
jgi:coenzyme F420 hydrogenase subunit beta